MYIQAKIKGINNAKLEEKDIEYIKKEMKAKLNYEVKCYVEKLIKDGDISFQFDCFEKNEVIGTLAFNLEIFNAIRDNELKLIFNKATSKTELVICDKKD